MVDRMGAWRRRRVLAGMVGATAALAAPAILRAAPSGKPVKVGGTLSLTGFLAQTAVIHKIAVGDDGRGDQRPERLPRPPSRVRAARRPVQARRGAQPLREADHRRQGRPDPGPYATAPILAAMGVAQRYGKVMIQSSMGIPKLQTYDRAFPATPFGPEPDKHLSQRHPRRDGRLPDAAQDHGDPDLEVPVGAVHGARHAGAGREAGRQGAALSRIRDRATATSAPSPRA